MAFKLKQPFSSGQNEPIKCLGFLFYITGYPPIVPLRFRSTLAIVTGSFVTESSRRPLINAGVHNPPCLSDPSRHILLPFSHQLFIFRKQLMGWSILGFMQCKSFVTPSTSLKNIPSNYSYSLIRNFRPYSCSVFEILVSFIKA